MEWMCFINAQSKLGATSVVHAVMQQMRKAQSEDLHEACEVSIVSPDTDHSPGFCRCVTIQSQCYSRAALLGKEGGECPRMS